MRCPNCGYISFDYLDQCVKCQTDLTQERERLNLPDQKPNPISFQEIMERMPIITKQEARPAKGETTIRTQAAKIPKTQEVDLSQGLSLDISVSSDEPSTKKIPPDLSLETEGLELSLEGIDLKSPSEPKGR